jgi:hypothetical protein
MIGAGDDVATAAMSGIENADAMRMEIHRVQTRN